MYLKCPVNIGNADDAAVLSEIYTLNTGVVTLDEVVCACARHMMALAHRQAARFPRLGDDLVSEAFVGLVATVERLRLGTLYCHGPTWQYILSCVAGRLRRYAAKQRIIVVPPTSYRIGHDHKVLRFDEVPELLGVEDHLPLGILLEELPLNSWERQYLLDNLMGFSDKEISERMGTTQTTICNRKKKLREKLKRKF